MKFERPAAEKFKEEIDPALQARISAYREKHKGKLIEFMSDNDIVNVIKSSDHGRKDEAEMKKKDPTRHQEIYGQDEMLK